MTPLKTLCQSPVCSFILQLFHGSASCHGQDQCISLSFTGEFYQTFKENLIPFLLLLPLKAPPSCPSCLEFHLGSALGPGALWGRTCGAPRVSPDKRRRLKGSPEAVPRRAGCGLAGVSTEGPDPALCHPCPGRGRASRGGPHPLPLPDVWLWPPGPPGRAD